VPVIILPEYVNLSTSSISCLSSSNFFSVRVLILSDFVFSAIYF
jgi:hypothetical protein